MICDARNVFVMETPTRHPPRPVPSASGPGEPSPPLPSFPLSTCGALVLCEAPHASRPTPQPRRDLSYVSHLSTSSLGRRHNCFAHFRVSKTTWCSASMKRTPWVPKGFYSNSKEWINCSSFAYNPRPYPVLRPRRSSIHAPRATQWTPRMEDE